MKKIVFSLMIVVGLGLIANNAFAQGTQLEPETGEVYTYTVDGLTDADAYTFVVNQDSTDYTAGQNAGDGSDYNMNSSLTGNPTGNEASMEIEWLQPGVYFLWIQMQDAVSDCYNYRYVRIEVENVLDFEIVAAAIGDTSTVAVGDIDDEDVTGGDGCAVVDGTQDWEDTDGTSSDGSTWIYYRVERVDGSTSGWTFDYSAANSGGTTTIDSYQGSADGTDWVDLASLTDIAVSGTEDVYYVRVKVALADDEQEITGTINNGEEDNGNVDSTPGAESAAFTITETPTIGGFN